MNIITVTKDSTDLDLTLDKLIVIRNSLHYVLFETDTWELHTLTGFHPHEMEKVLNSVERVIKEFQ